MLIDLITVVFRDELSLLPIQAKSLEKYVGNINSIVIVVNDEDPVADQINTAWWEIGRAHV